jgi:predicted transcriptional regulator
MVDIQTQTVEVDDNYSERGLLLHLNILNEKIINVNNKIEELNKLGEELSLEAEKLKDEKLTILNKMMKKPKKIKVEKINDDVKKEERRLKYHKYKNTFKKYYEKNKEKLIEKGKERYKQQKQKKNNNIINV